MAAFDRFLKLGGAAPVAAGPASDAERSRFAEVGGGVQGTETQRSGGEPERFSPPPETRPDAPLRLREDDGGQPFVRCRLCRFDNARGARSCGFCDADLTTPAQRSFNDTLWERTLAERAEQREESVRLQAAQRAQQATHAAAMQELLRLRLDQYGWQGHDFAGSFGGLFAEAGAVIARWLVRCFPDRRRRLLVLFGLLVVANLLSWLAIRAWGGPLSGFLWGFGLVVQAIAVLRAWSRARSV